ncbi:hypothetical protein D7Y13_18025 [Corallococcus praedator]|uniref:Delta-60 repeat domain-containing protein n=1 Tax=Corallococcus praedator TaxID=2316724 RepID=A0ABX9QIS1_9BACT|nr:hypothetical protein D7X75_14800 [Corallococcus sp. CA031C]RKI07358.1 hypothetical protein D7Y13_18025 [Corallococcus praedator]
MHPFRIPSLRGRSLSPRLRSLTALALTVVALGTVGCDSEEPSKPPPVTPARDAGVDAGPGEGTDSGVTQGDGGTVDPTDAGVDAGVTTSFRISTVPELTARFDPKTATSVLVDVLREPPFTAGVSLSVEGLPPHVRTVQPLPVIIPETENSTPLGFYPDEFAAYGRFPLTLVGLGGGDRVEFPFTLDIQPGRAALDSAFGTGGVAMPALGLTSVRINAVAAQSDGKWVLVGSTGSTGLRDVLVARLLPDGSPDTSFGSQGVVVTDVCAGDDYVDAVTVLSDGRILVAGGALAGTNTCSGTKYQSVLLARYTSTGAPDTTFGGTGVRTFQLSTGSSTLHAVTVDTNGRIVGAGTVQNGNLDLLVIRLLPTGEQDTTFSGDGVASANPGQEDDGLCVVAESDGKIMVAGTTSGNFNKVALERFNADGTRDRSFNYFTDLRSVEITPRTLHRLADGRWLLGGRAVYSDGSMKAALARVTATGSEDTSFNGTGYTYFTTAFIGGKDAVVGTGLLPDGTLAVATWSQDDSGASGLGVVHVSADGATVLRSHRTELPGDEKPTAAVLDSAGFLRVAGTQIPEGQTEAVPFVTRFHPY